MVMTKFIKENYNEIIFNLYFKLYLYYKFTTIHLIEHRNSR